MYLIHKKNVIQKTYFNIFIHKTLLTKIIVKY